MNKVYSKIELDFIKDNAATLTDAKLTSAFNDQFGKTVSFAAMRKLRQRLGVVKKSGRPKKALQGRVLLLDQALAAFCKNKVKNNARITC